MGNLNKEDTRGSIKHLPDQCQQAWQEASKLNLPPNYKDVANIVVAGMGGSSYGARIVKSLYTGAQITGVSLELANNYWLPGYIGPDSLVVLSSYSGATEETLAAARQAKQKAAKIFGITTGGKLAEFLKTNHYPAYIFNPVYNPSRQPRIGTGYMIMGLISLLSRLKKIPVGNSEIEKLVAFLREKTASLNDSVPTNHNPARQLAEKLEDKIPVFIVADFLEGAAYAVRNIFHETAKQFTLHFTIPELNHHLLEGLTFPSEIKKNLRFIFVVSSIYDCRNSKRMKLTREVVEKNEFVAESITLRGYSGLTQVMEFIQLGTWVAFYLATIHGIDPAKIPWVDYFKEKLSAKD